ncbi:hypothetical protein ILUMI_09193 [Ignelater luminosus]|uniref:Uncharacterized protein n=1 Tax=Ignelater luminosus TaxID=2038154 RepID=A0A8K0GFA3_IGNLU|nr:hypothetical protein ILUMI_09193 [Ignelater luminosus]
MRLDELCCFLRSLLKQKSVLGFLGMEQASKLQEVVDKSLDLSRTLSATMSLNPDQSLLQLSNITNLLNSTRNDSFNLSEFFTHDEENNAVLSIIPSDITLTYQSHLHKSLNCTNEQAEVIKVLREQVQDLKREIQLRDVELEKRLISEQGEKPLENDEEFVDALVDLQPNSSPQINSPSNVYRSLVEEATRLNATSSTAVAEKSTLNTTSTTLKNLNIENNSESESWSEPDRTVSMARIGLQDESLKRPSTSSLSSRRARFVSGSNMSTESTEDEQLHNLSRTPSKRSSLSETRQTIIALHEQVCGLEIQLKEKENQLLAAQVAFYETDNLLKQEQAKIEQARQENVHLTAQVADATKKLEEVEQQKCIVEENMKAAQKEHAKLIRQIKETTSKLEEAEKRKADAEEKISELQTLVSILQEFKKNVEMTMDTKNKEMQNILNEMEIEKMKAVGAAQDAEKLLKNAQNDLHSMQNELANMEIREQKLRNDLEKEYKHNLKKVEERYALNLKTAEHEYEVQAKKCREAVVQIKENYEKEYIKKSEVDRRTLEVEEITKEVGKLQGVIYDCELKMNGMEKREIELKNKVQELQQEHQQKINDLHKELDSATLQYSEAILEKTKLQNETSTLEQKVQMFYTKENELIKEVNKLHKEYQETQANLQSHITQLEHKKSFMELKISNLEAVNAELQSANAELRNRLVKIQIGKNINDVITSTSLPNNPGKILDLYPNKTLPITIKGFCHYSRELSDHSGYTSEDIPIDEGGLRDALNAMHAGAQNVSGLGDDNERVHASSSPDLGIESDHGRFSSLEANVTLPRPLLPTLELTQSMSNLLDPVQDVSCANDQCCKKMAQENVELRKRLLRTRRALEETLNRLTLANKQKKEVEKSICKQIVKTSQVLRKAKANLDSGSETDLLKK